MIDVEAIQLIFPNGSVIDRRVCAEINNLTEDCVPQNCKIVLAGYKDLNQIFYFVETEQYGFYLRLCKAASGSAYAKYAVVHEMISSNDPEYGKFYTDTLRRVSHYVK